MAWQAWHRIVSIVSTWYRGQYIDLHTYPRYIQKTYILTDIQSTVPVEFCSDLTTVVAHRIPIRG